MKKLTLILMTVALFMISAISQAVTTYDTRETTTDAYPANASGRAFILHYKVDLSDDNLGSGDHLVIGTIPAGMYVRQAIVRTVTTEAAALTVDLGDATDAGSGTFNEVDFDGFINDANLSVSANTVYCSDDPTTGATVKAYSEGKFYPASKALILTSNAASADAAVFYVDVIGWRLKED